MAGTIAGGKAAAATNKAKYGSDFYRKIGAEGGKLGRTGGFFANRELARIAGRKGGHRSNRSLLTPEQAEEMRRLRKLDAHEWTYLALAKAFGIAEGTVYKYLHPHKRKEQPQQR